MANRVNEVLQVVGAEEGEDEGKAMHAADANAYLTPLQKSLVYELTTRRSRIATANSRADFWHQRQREPQKDKFQLDVLDEDFYDRNIIIRKEELRKLQETKLYKEAIIQAADATHTINASMANATLTHSKEMIRPPFRQSLRQMAARRDELALEYLRVDAELKQIRSERRGMANNINATRERTSSLIAETTQTHQGVTEQKKNSGESLHETLKEVGSLGKAGMTREFIFSQKESLEKATKRKNADEVVTLKSGEIRQLLERISLQANTPPEIRRFVEVSLELRDEVMKEVIEGLGRLVKGRIYREYVRGTLRSLILESGLVWQGSKNKNLEELMLTLGNDDPDGSEEELDLDSEGDEGG